MSKLVNMLSMKMILSVHVMINSILSFLRILILIMFPLTLLNSNFLSLYVIDKLPDVMQIIIKQNDKQASQGLYIIIGAYISIVSTYFFNSIETKKKYIINKEFTIYSPIYTELKNLNEYEYHKMIYRFSNGQGYYDENSVIWRYWDEQINDTNLKFSVPYILNIKICSLNCIIKEYIKDTDILKTHLISNFMTIGKKHGLDEKTFQSPYYNILDHIIDNSISLEHVLESYPNYLEVDKNEKAIETFDEIKIFIKNDIQYSYFIKKHYELEQKIADAYNGLEYLLNRIHNKYKGKKFLI